MGISPSAQQVAPCPLNTIADCDAGRLRIAKAGNSWGLAHMACDTCLVIVQAARLHDAWPLPDMTSVLLLHAELRLHWRQLWSSPVSHQREVV